jgi:hypothetical protein
LALGCTASHAADENGASHHSRALLRARAAFRSKSTKNFAKTARAHSAARFRKEKKTCAAEARSACRSKKIKM